MPRTSVCAPYVRRYRARRNPPDRRANALRDVPPVGFTHE
jgi:hypothetical protein